jgi:virginiamycin B lyase
MRTGTLLAAALCAAALSACGGGGGGSPSTPPPPASTAPPAPTFSTVPIPSTSTQRGIPLTGDRLSVAVLADGTVAYSNRFYWGLVKAGGDVSTWSGSFDGGGPLAFGRGGDGSLYAGNSVPAGNDLASSVLDEATGAQWSFSAYPPWVILAGPDGGTWVLTFNGGMVRLGPGGTTTSLPITAPPGDAEDVTVGSDGAFWLAEFSGALERVPLHGAPLRFPVDGHPTRIAAGADGALWFLDNAGLVRRMTMSGQTRTYFSTGQFTEADAIAAGRDGAMWLTNGGANELVRIAPDGTVARFAAPATGDSPSGIVAGPDGTLYFFEQNFRGLVLVHATPH